MGVRLLSEVEELQALLASAGVFIVTGVTKSGTTWLQRMLDSHPEIACGGESKLNVFLTQLGPALRAYNEALDKTNDKIYREQAVYPPLEQPQARAASSEVRRVGKEGVRTFKTGWSPVAQKKT